VSREGNFCGKKPSLHLFGNFHVPGDPVFRFHALRHLLSKIDVFQGHACPGGHGIEQVFVLARVGFFGKALAKDH